MIVYINQRGDCVLALSRDQFRTAVVCNYHGTRKIRYIDNLELKKYYQETDESPLRLAEIWLKSPLPITQQAKGVLQMAPKEKKEVVVKEKKVKEPKAPKEKVERVKVERVKAPSIKSEETKFSILESARMKQTGARFAIFSLIEKTGPMTPAEVAEALGRTKTSVASDMRCMVCDRKLVVVE